MFRCNIFGKKDSNAIVISGFGIFNVFPEWQNQRNKILTKLKPSPVQCIVEIGYLGAVCADQLNSVGSETPMDESPVVDVG